MATLKMIIRGEKYFRNHTSFRAIKLLRKISAFQDTSCRSQFTRKALVYLNAATGAYARGLFGVNPPPWAWYFTKI